MVFAGTSQTSPRIVESSETPALHLQNVRIDPRDGKLRGTAQLNFGYAAPQSPHVHIYALNAAGNVIYEGCDMLSKQLLSPHPRFPAGRDAFSAQLPADLKGAQTIEVVASSGHRDCKMDDNRIFKNL